MAEGLTGFRVRLLGWKKAGAVESVPDILFVGDVVRLIEERDVHVFLDVLKELSPKPVLVILDTLSRCLVGGDENNSRDMGKLIDAADRIRKELGAAVLLVHHPGKLSKSERGHGNLRGAADTMLELTDAGGDLRILASDKQKDAEPFRPIGLRLIPIDLDGGQGTLLFEADDSVEGARSMPESEAKIVAALTARGGNAITSVLRRESGVPDTTFFKSIKRLLERGAIEKSGGGRNVLYRIVQAEQTVTPTSLPSHNQGSDTSSTTSPPPLLKGAGEVSAGSVNLDHLSSDPLPDEPAVLPPQAPAADRGRRKKRPVEATKPRAQHGAEG